jgi:beta-glucosidase-like glycosyl hydrolase/CubicO group peptidase (beta-lactamase class C family)
MKKLFAPALFLLSTIAMFAQQANPLIVKNSLPYQQKWVDSIYGEMSLQEKVGQLFMVDVFSSDPIEKTNKIKKLIREQHIGGIIFSKGGPVRQAKLNNEFQNEAKYPLMIAMDAEWGLAMRLDSTYAFPWNMTLGAIQDNKIVEEVGHRIGLHTRRMGMHINFAPVVDINTNPKNPIIGNRSFGEDMINVSEKASAFMKGMQRAGVLANAKHFPGHGDTDQDSHKTLPTVAFSKARIDSVELYPYRKLINEGLSSIMVAHLNIPSLESREGYPSSISKFIVTDMLKGQLGFNGLVFTDALNMKGAANFSTPGEIDLAAFMAGNDVLLISEDIPKAHALLVNAYREEVITEARLAHSVKKILFAKFKAGLHRYQPVSPYGLVPSLNAAADDALYEKAMESAITVVKNDSVLLPITDLQNKKFAYVNFGDADGKSFLDALRKYDKIDHVKANDISSLLKKLKSYDQVIIGFHKSNENPWKSYTFSTKELEWLQKIAANNKVILDVFTSPYALLQIQNISEIKTVVVSYQNSDVAQSLSAQIIFGARQAKGRLPVSIGSAIPVGSGVDTRLLKRLQYGTAESVGMSSYKFYKIDSLARVGLWGGMTPGMQIIVARNGKVVYDKNFGYHTQSEKNTVKSNDLYDVASLTKILATLPIIMDLFDRGVINMDTKLKEMLPEYRGTDKANITLKEMLTHTARLKAWIPFYIKTMDSVTKKPSNKWFRKNKEEDFTIPVAKNLFMKREYKDSIYRFIKESELRESKGYKYSDLPYYLLKKYVEEFYGTPLEVLVQRNLYEPLGANNTTYLPLDKFTKIDIVPTEYDTYFRQQVVHGYVHDQGTAMLGGVGGHAGLFSTANDVAKIMQMYLWKGTYGDKQYFKPETIDAFNTCYYCDDNVRRGVGFDKPQLGDVGPTCGCVSMNSFGHSGFTGTFTWADPDQGLIYVFMSNRTYPDAENRKLIERNLRSNIQEVIYEAINVKY